MKKFMDEDFLLTSDVEKNFIMIMQRTCRL